MLAVSRLTRVGAQHLLRQKACFSTQGSKLIINAVGQDRVGIVSDVAGVVIDAGGNVGDSNAARLGDNFSLMMLVTVPEDKLDHLKARLSALSDVSAAIFAAADISDTARVAGYSGIFTVEGADHPGIVHSISSALAKHGLSIEKMQTDQEIAPYGGSMLFRMRGIASAAAPLAKSFDSAVIQKELKDLGDSLNCDVTLEDKIDDSASGVFYAG